MLLHHGIHRRAHPGAPRPNRAARAKARRGQGGAVCGHGLTVIHVNGMVFHVKTTLNIDDGVMRQLKQAAAREGKTMSELVETALRLLLQRRRKRSAPPELPRYRMGAELVDVSNREALHEAMERP